MTQSQKNGSSNKSDTLREKLLTIIRTIHKNKVKAKIYPDFAISIEIMRAIELNDLDITWSESKKELNSMVKEKILTFGRTANYIYFKEVEHGKS